MGRGVIAPSVWGSKVPCLVGGEGGEEGRRGDVGSLNDPGS